MTPHAPGSFRPLRDRWGSFEALCARLPEGALALVDRRVARLHPHVKTAIASRRPALLIEVRAGEQLKQLAVAERILGQALRLPRSATVLAVGGGTLGDLAGVVAHLHKRGARLVHAPTTLLAAVDSSVGGKGAVHLQQVKNALGVFHYPDESWLCPELFGTLSPAQRREGLVEAYKMAVCLDARTWRSWTRRPPGPLALLRRSRALKAKICEADPYEQTGLRRVLNFGHTFGHALETLSGFRIRHGDAVGLGMLCALDLGRAEKVTRAPLADEVEDALTRTGPVPRGRERLARALAHSSAATLQRVLQSDKKATSAGALTMILLQAEGRAGAVRVEHAAWRALLPRWRRGARP